MFMYNGIGAFNPAEITGANAVVVLASALQNPKTRVLKIVGISYTNAKKHMLKLAEIPNFARTTKTGIRLTLSTYFMRKTEPIMERAYCEKKPQRAPT